MSPMDANFAFGNTGTLNEMLKMAQSEAHIVKLSTSPRFRRISGM